VALKGREDDTIVANEHGNASEGLVAICKRAAV